MSQLGASSRQVVLTDLPRATILVGVDSSAFKGCQWLRCHLSSPNVVVDRGATLAADSIFLLFGEDGRSAGYTLISTLCYCMNLIRKDKHKTPGYLSSQTSLLELNGVIIDHIATQGRKAVMQASLPMLVWHSNSIKPIDSSNC